MAALKVFLWIMGLMCLTSVVGVFLPISQIDSMMTNWCGVGLPEGPVMVYFVRVMSVTYAAIGLFFIMLAVRPLEYKGMVPFAGVASAIIGIVCLVVGRAAGLPGKAYVWDFLGGFILGVLIFMFWAKARKAAETGAAPAGQAGGGVSEAGPPESQEGSQEQQQ
jgi:hypothetical protein